MESLSAEFEAVPWIFRKLANRKQKNLKVSFCSPTEPHQCKSSVNQTWHGF